MPGILNWGSLDDRRFEELCCQLARSYVSDREGTFYRVDGSGGDEGVEAFFVLPDGTMWGWQSKFFLGRLNSNRWRHIRDSIRRALECHDALRKYYVCVPINLTLSEIKEWRRLRTEHCDRVQLELWSASYLEHLLVRPENVGKRAFFFQEVELDEQWFRDRLNEARVSLGDRYTPDAHVALPQLIDYFDVLGRTRRFRSILLEWSNRISGHREQVQHFRGTAIANAQLELHDRIIERLDRLSTLLRRSAENLDPRQRLPVEELTLDGGQAVEEARGLRQALEACGIGKVPDQAEKRYAALLWKTVTLISDLIERKENQKWHLANEVGLALYGEAGIGKSHCLFDAALFRQNQGLFSVFVLGHQFPTNSQPIADLSILLGLGPRLEDEVLGALSSAAESTGAPLIIFIDALNESERPSYWADHLPVLAERLRRHPWLRIVVSYRSVYRRELIGERPVMPEIEHPGFAGHETDALSRLCAIYSVEFPSLPILSPEFYNPLFLHLVLRALRDAGETVWPRGLHGFKRAYELFVDNCSKRVARRLNCEPGAQWVYRAIQTLASRMANWGRDWVTVEEAKEIADSVYPERATRLDYGHSLFRALIDEHVIAVNRIWSQATGRWTEAVRFTFQRFADHAIAEQLLSLLGDHPSAEELRAAFGPDGLIDLRSTGPNVVEALAIQLPERFGIELVDCVNWGDDYLQYLVRQAMLHSLIWRDPSAFPPVERLRTYVNEGLGGLTDEVFDVLLAVCARPEHPLNADILHRNLIQMSMAKRDAVWTLYLHDRMSDPHSPIKRVLDWGQRGDFRNVDLRCVELFAAAVCWFFTSSNREFRDCATKILARVFHHRLDCAKSVLERFEDVDDLYVRERLYSAVYGACLWHDHRHREFLAEIARWFYDQEFKDGSPVLHLLARDYARGIMEVAARADALPEGVDLKRVRPPYRSPWPLEDAPPLPNWDKFGERSGLLAVAASLSTALGDFACYVVTPEVKRFVVDLQNSQKADVLHALRWLYARILQLGYTDQSFGNHDAMCRRYSDRTDHRNERIGKKYQWIALNEYLARLADNCLLHLEWEPSNPTTYNGPWEIGMRDVDPSCWLEGEVGRRSVQHPWWTPFPEALSTGSWKEYIEWVCRMEDLPSYCEQLMRSLWVSDPSGHRWISVYANHSVQAAGEPGKEMGFGSPRRDMWFHVRGYLVTEQAAVLEWSRSQDFWDHWMPEWNGLGIYEAFLGEYPWHPSWEEARQRAGWRKPERQGNCQQQFRVPYVTYAWSRDYDYSKESGARLALPAPWLVKAGDLRFDRDSLVWRDRTGRIVAWDPAGALGDQPHVLLLDADWLGEFLKRTGLGLFWAVSGEKRCAAGLLAGAGATNRLSGGFIWTGSGIEGDLRSVECTTFPIGQADEGRDHSPN